MDVGSDVAASPATYPVRHYVVGRCREAAAAGSATAPCHAPASASNVAECGDKFLAAWDTIVALSRATLKREIRVLVRTSPPFAGTSAATGTALSRASLGR